MATAKPKTLRELTGDQIELVAQLEAGMTEEGEYKGDMEVIMKLIKVQVGTSAKLENMIHYIENLEYIAMVAKAESDAAKEILGRARTRQTVAENKITSVKFLIREHMHATGETEIKTKAGRAIKEQANGGKKTVTLPSEIDITRWDEDLFNMEPVPDTDAIRSAHEAGRELPPGVSVYQGTHIRIK